MLIDRGHDVEVFASSPRGTHKRIVDGVPVQWIQSEVNGIEFASTVAHFFANRHVEKPFDVVEGAEFNAETRYVRKFVPSIPCVVRLHTPSLLIHEPLRRRDLWFYLRWNAGNAKELLRSLLQWRRPEPWYWDDLDRLRRIDALEKDACLKADLVASPCQVLADWAIENWGVDAAKIRVSPYPYIPDPDFLAIPESCQGFISTHPVVGFVGRTDRKKGIETFKEIIPIVAREFPNVCFRFVGGISNRFGCDTPYDQWLKKALPNHQENIDFIGKVPLDQVAKAYSLMDVCVFPSLWENFPNVCLEAMSGARAIVGSTEGGMPEMLDRGLCGLLADPYNGKEIANRILDYLKDAKLRKEKGLAARDRILKNYNSQIVGEQVEQIYFSVCSGRSQTSRFKCTNPSK